LVSIDGHLDTNVKSSNVLDDIDAREVGVFHVGILRNHKPKVGTLPPWSNDQKDGTCGLWRKIKEQICEKSVKICTMCKQKV